MYVDLSNDIKADMKKMKESLLEKAGLVQDPLTARKLFISCCQCQDEKVEDFGGDLKRLFKRARI